MESNWRFNVWDQGLSMADIRLAAREIADPNVWVVGWNFAPGGATGLIGINPFSGAWEFHFPFQFHTGSFPFGIPVEPDS